MNARSPRASRSTTSSSRRVQRSTSAPDNAIGTINRLYPDGDFNYGVTGIPTTPTARSSATPAPGTSASRRRPRTPELSVAIAKFFAGPEGFQDLVRRTCANCRRASTCSTRCRSTTSIRSSSSTRDCRRSASRASRRLATPNISRSSPSWRKTSPRVKASKWRAGAGSAVQMEQALAEVRGLAGGVDEDE